MPIIMILNALSAGGITLSPALIDRQIWIVMLLWQQVCNMHKMILCITRG